MVLTFIVDFNTLQSAKDGEPFWESPWGPGRPGWHIECSAMSAAYLGYSFDIHGGGMDLVFPHHENEIAQSCAACEHSNITYWVHNGFVTIDSEKMSKSLGNFFTIRQVKGFASMSRGYLIKEPFIFQIYIDCIQQIMILSYPGYRTLPSTGFTALLNWDTL